MNSTERERPDDPAVAQGPAPPPVQPPVRQYRLDESDAAVRRRLRLRVVAKSMIAVAFFAMLFAFGSAFLSGNRDDEGAKPGMRVDLATIGVGQSSIFTWQGRPVIVVRRDARTVQTLQGGGNGAGGEGPALEDAASERSEQPASAVNPLRSVDPANPAWFVAIALGTDYGCPIAPLPFEDGGVAAGFIDECRGSRYDAAGRVFADQYADRNLVVPAYTIRGDVLILGR